MQTRLLTITSAIALLAVTAGASNTGFKLTKELITAPTGQSGANWVSLPYRYFPSGNILEQQLGYSAERLPELLESALAKYRPAAEVEPVRPSLPAPSARGCGQKSMSTWGPARKR